MMNMLEKIIADYKEKTLAINGDESLIYVVDFKSVLPGKDVRHQYELTLIAAKKDGQILSDEDIPDDIRHLTIEHRPLQGSLLDALAEAGFSLLKENENVEASEETVDSTKSHSFLLMSILKKNFRQMGYAVHDGGPENFAIHDEDDCLVATVVGGGEGFIMNKQLDETYLDERYQIRSILEKGLEEVRVVQAALKRDVNMEYEGLPVGWKQITAFAGVLLGMKLMERGIEYATWREDQDGKGVSWGQYFTDFQKVKENFALRSGIVRAENLFTETQMKIIMDGLVQLGQMDAVADGVITDEEMSRYTKIIEEIRRRFPDIEIALAEQNEIQREEINEKVIEYGG